MKLRREMTVEERAAVNCNTCVWRGWDGSECRKDPPTNDNSDPHKVDSFYPALYFADRWCGQWMGVNGETIQTMRYDKEDQ